MSHSEFWSLTPGQLEERYEAAIERRKEWFNLIQMAAASGFSGDMVDPDEIYERRSLNEPEWKREVAKLDAILPESDKDID